MEDDISITNILYKNYISLRIAKRNNMKQTTFLMILVIALTLLSCKDNSTNPSSNNFISATISGEFNMSYYSNKVTLTKKSIGFRLASATDGNLNTLSVSIDDTIPGTYPTQLDDYGRIVNFQDHTNDNPYFSGSGEIVITQNDAKVIKGTFACLAFNVRDHGMVNITNGKFEFYK